MASKKNSPSGSDSLPFGAGTFDGPQETPRSEPKRAARAPAPESSPSPARTRPPAEPAPAADVPRASAAAADESGAHAPKAGARRRRGRGRGRGRGGPEEREAPQRSAEAPEGEQPAADEPRARAESGPAPESGAEDFQDFAEQGENARGAARSAEQAGEARALDGTAPPALDGPVDPSAAPRRSGRAERRRRWQERRRRRRLGLPLDDLAPQSGGAAENGGGRPGGGPPGGSHSFEGRGARPATAHGAPPREARPAPPVELREIEGLLVLDKGNYGELRRREFDYLPSKEDVGVAPWQIQKFALRDGALVKGSYRRGQGRNRWELVDVLAVDGLDPREARKVPVFKNLVTIDPDFHYALGDGSGEVALKVVDVICPIGRGQRGLIVASPRSGKTILLRQIAKAMEQIYPDVHLMVLLVDERPEEATEWKRSVTHGEVFVSTNDEPAKKHVELAEIVWRRARRLVELGKDVVLLIDSITRLGRAANNVWGTSGKTMSGGIDSRALERPKALFGSARNTEAAGSLTILGTTLVDTGSRMDQIIFEEFKGTGNMELVLSRKLADRRIFPAIDLERSGTRKDEKLHSAKRLARCNTLRRVLMRMHFAEAMELLITKLGDVDKIDDFLQRFEIDPDAGDEGKQAVSPVRMRW